MAQRVYFVFSNRDLIRTVEDYVLCPSGRRSIRQRLAEGAHTHLRAVTVSERVVASVYAQTSGALSNDRFLFAANVMPYLLAARDEEGVLAGVRWLESSRSESELEEFFVAQARLLALPAGELDRGDFRIHSVAEIAQHLSKYLDYVVAQHAWMHSRITPTPWQRIWRSAQGLIGKADGFQKDPAGSIAAYGSEVWRALGKLFGRLRPAWWQARDRWLGYLSQRDQFRFRQTTISTLALEGASTSMQVEPLPIDGSQTGAGIAELGELMSSTAGLAPRLRVEGWEGGLPVAGEAYTTCAFIEPESAGVLRHHLRGATWPEWKPRVAKVFGGEDSDVEDWRTIVCSAARYAEERNLLMFEGDEIFTHATRWPMF